MALVDVDTTKTWVVEKMKTWVKTLVDTYKGIRDSRAPVVASALIIIQ